MLFKRYENINCEYWIFNKNEKGKDKENSSVSFCFDIISN